ncbi:MAG: hypothetical protein ACTHKB_15765 [Burkholderiaceae bacterium]
MTAWWKVGALLLALLIGAAGGWIGQGWRKDRTIADLQATTARDARAQADAILADFKGAADAINAAALAVKLDRSATNAKLSTIAGQLKTLRPLPADCTPGADRVSNVRAAVDAANAAAARR